MNSKKIVMLGMVVGSTIGGYIPTFFGFSAFSYASVVTTAIGGAIGIYITYKLTV